MAAFELKHVELLFPTRPDFRKDFLTHYIIIHNNLNVQGEHKEMIELSDRCDVSRLNPGFPFNHGHATIYSELSLMACISTALFTAPIHPRDRRSKPRKMRLIFSCGWARGSTSLCVTCPFSIRRRDDRSECRDCGVRTAKIVRKKVERDFSREKVPTACGFPFSTFFFLWRHPAPNSVDCWEESFELISEVDSKPSTPLNFETTV